MRLMVQEIRYFIFTFQICSVSFVRSLYFRMSSAFLLITFMSPEIAASISMYVPSSFCQIMMSGLLLGMVLLVCTS